MPPKKAAVVAQSAPSRRPQPSAGPKVAKIPLDPSIISLVFAALSISLLLRYSIAMWPYSGFSKPPMFGDYEAQRHWMEITTKLSISDWYKNTTQNDLQYWGLDYPPLTALHSWICGKITEFVEPEAVVLYTSRGYQTPSHKLLMRSTVILADLFIWFPAVAVFVSKFYKDDSRWAKFFAFMLIANQPALFLIDHGHFQYNSISLGLTLWAIDFLLFDQDFLGSVFFSLALNYKQMSLFHAPAFFFYLLGKNLNLKQPYESRSFSALHRHLTLLYHLPCSVYSILKLVCIGVAVIGTFAACWAPFFLNGGPDAVLQVVSRIFPVGRGLFEDKVANFWCSVSPVLRMKEWFSVQALVKICTASTLLAMAPSCLLTLLKPSKDNFLLCLIASSFSFFFFGFQVHEKSILLPLLPVSLFVLRATNFVTWQQLIGAFSMYPLLIRDGQTIPYVTFCFLTVAISIWALPKLKASYMLGLILALGACHYAFAFVEPPAKYPDLLTLLITGFSFANFGLGFIYILWQQYNGKSL